MRLRLPARRPSLPVTPGRRLTAVLTAAVLGAGVAGVVTAPVQPTLPALPSPSVNLAAAALPDGCEAQGATVTCVWHGAGDHRVTVPASVSQIEVGLLGAQGGAEPDKGTGGLGGSLTATVPLGRVHTLQILVGGQGSNGVGGGGTGGSPDGGTGGNGHSNADGCGGGGSTSVRSVEGATIALLAAAGGGGGCGGGASNSSAPGGAGGGAQGSPGGNGGKSGYTSCTVTARGGGGATQSAGGTAGAVAQYYSAADAECLDGTRGGTSGGRTRGGDGGATDQGQSSGGGGGGGGWYGGGGGAGGEYGSGGAAGGGGSSGAVAGSSISENLGGQNAGGGHARISWTLPSASISSSAEPALVGGVLGLAVTTTVTGGAGTPTGSAELRTPFRQGAFTFTQPVACQDGSSRTLDASGRSVCLMKGSLPAGSQIQYSGDASYATTYGSVQASAAKGTPTVAVTTVPKPGGFDVTATVTAGAYTHPEASTATIGVGWGDDQGAAAGTVCADQPLTAGSTPGTASVTCSFTSAEPGTEYTFTGSFAGHAALQPASGSAAATAGRSTTSVALTRLAPEATTVGDVAGFSVTVTGSQPTGTVDVYGAVEDADFATPLCTVTLNGGAGSCTARIPAIALVVVGADYAGDTRNLASSTLDRRALTIGRAPTATTVATSDTSPLRGSTVVLTSTSRFDRPVTTAPAGTTADPLTGPVAGGTVTFSSVDAAGTRTALTGCTGRSLGSAGTATCTTTATGASLRVVAEYTGAAQALGSTAPVLTINPRAVGAALALTAATSSAGQATLTTRVTLTNGGSTTPTGTVTVHRAATGGTQDPATDPTACTTGSLVADGSDGWTATCSYPVPAGSSQTLYAVYDADFLAAPAQSSPVTVTGRPLTTTTTVQLPTGDAVFGAPVAATVVVAAEGGSTPTGTVAVRVDDTAVATCGSVALAAGRATCQLTGLAPGDHAVTASFAATASAAASTSAAATVTVVAQTSSTALTASPAGRGLVLVATVTSPNPATGTVTFTGPGTGDCTDRPLSGTTATCTVTSTPAGESTFAAAFTDPAGGTQDSAGDLTYGAGTGGPCTDAFTTTWDAVAGGPATLRLGPGTAVLGAVGDVGGCSSSAALPVSATVSFFGGTLAGTVTGTLSQAAGLCIDPGQSFSAPAWLRLPSLSIAALCVPTGATGVVSGALSSTGTALPVLDVPGLGAVRTTVGFAGTLAAPTMTLTAASDTTTASVTVARDGSVDASLSSSALRLLGQQLDLAGTFTRTAAGALSASVTGTLPGTVDLVAGATISGVTVSVDGEGGLGVAGTLTAGAATNPLVLDVSGTLTSTSTWSLAVASTAPWTPLSGLTVDEVTGTLAAAPGDGGTTAYTYDLAASGSPLTRWAPAPGAALAVTSVRLSTDADTCDLGTDTGTDPLISVAGTVTVGDLEADTDGCADLRTGAFHLGATSSSPFSPFDGLSATITSLTVDGGAGRGLAVAGSADATYTVAGKTLSSTLRLTRSAEGALVLGGSVDLTPLGLPVSGYLAYASAATDGFDTGVTAVGNGGLLDLPAGVTALGSVTMPAAVRTAVVRAGFAVAEGGVVPFRATIPSGAGAIRFTADLPKPSRLPFLTLPASGGLDDLTLGYVDGALTISAAAHVQTGVPLAMTLTVARTGAVDGRATVTGLPVLGSVLDLAGSVAVAPGGAVTAAVTGRIPGPVVPSAGVPVSITDVTVGLGTTGLSLAGTGTVAGAGSLAVAADIASPTSFTLRVTGTASGWSPTPGTTLAGSLAGTVVVAPGVPAAVDLSLTGAVPGAPLLGVTAGAASAGLTSVRLSNTAATPAGCTLTAAGDLWLGVAGTLAGRLGSASGSGAASGCFDITSGAFTLGASIPALTVDASGGRVDVDTVSLVVSRAVAAAGVPAAYTVTGTARLSVSFAGGGQFAQVLSLSLRGSEFVLGAKADLSRFIGAPSTSAYLYYASSAAAGVITGDPVLGTLTVPQGLSVGMALPLPTAVGTALGHLGIQVPGGQLAATGTLDPATRSLTLGIAVSAAPGTQLLTTSATTGVRLDRSTLQVAIGGGQASFAMKVDALLTVPVADGTGTSSVPVSGSLALGTEGFTAELHTAGTWTDAFGVRGLVVDRLAVQGGISPTGTPNAGIAATVSALPPAVADAVGYTNGAPITLAANLSLSAFLLDIGIGTPGSGTPALRPLNFLGSSPDAAVRAQAGLIGISYARLTVSPKGAVLGGVTYPAGYGLAFDATVAGVGLRILAKVDPATPSLSFTGSLDQITAGKLTVGPVTVNLQASPSTFQFTVDGSFAAGPGTSDIGPALRVSGSIAAQARLSLGTAGISATASGTASVQGSAYVSTKTCYSSTGWPSACAYVWKDAPAVSVTLTNVGFDVNSDGISIAVPNTDKRITVPFGGKPAAGQLQPASASTPIAAGQLQPASSSRDLPVHRAPADRAPGDKTEAQTWHETGDLGAARGLSSSVTLADGRVLVIGGLRGGQAQPAVEVYDPASGSWRSLAPLGQARYGAVAAVLPDGRVLVAGGAADGEALTSAEVYDPAADSWSATDDLADGRLFAAAAVLGDGRVVVAGGGAQGAPLASSQTYDPASGSWSQDVPTADARAFATVTTLADGRVLLAGGESADGALASAELYDPAADAWTATAPMATERTQAVATRLADGRALVAGGSPTVEVFDPATATWAPLGTLGSARQLASLTTLDDGRVLVAGGVVGNPGGDPVTSGTTDLFDPATEVWSDGPTLPAGRQDAVLAALPGGGALLTGGSVGEEAQQASWVLAAGDAAVPAGVPGPADDGSGSPWSWVVGGLGLLVLVAAGVVVTRRRRSRPRHG